LNLGWKLALTISGAAAPSLLQTLHPTRRLHRFSHPGTPLTTAAELPRPDLPLDRA
jgi:hypothetical protein